MKLVFAVEKRWGSGMRQRSSKTALETTAAAATTPAKLGPGPGCEQQ